MSTDYYGGPAEDRISEFTRARASEVRAEFQAIADSLSNLPSLDDLRYDRTSYAVASGTANALLVTLSPAPAGYFDGMGLVVKLAATNTGAATINVNGLGVKQLRRPDGTAVSASDLQAGGIVSLRYDSVSGTFRVMVGTVTINQEGIDILTAAAQTYALSANTAATTAAANAAAAAASVATYTAADVLSKILTVDGSGSGLDADKVRNTTPGTFGLTLLGASSSTAAKASLSLDNVNNTSDANKPISTATQSALNAKAPIASPTFTGTVTLPGAPTSSLHAATKAYVDALSQGWRTLVGGAARLTTAGTNHGLSGLSAIDGVTPVAGDRILVPTQTSQAENGVYVAAAGAWSRVADADTWAEIYNTVTLVTAGTTYKNTQWVAAVGNTGTLGSTALPYSQVGGSSAYNASGSVTQTVNTFSLTPIADGRVLGNVSGALAEPVAITGTQLTAILDTFGTNPGLVPGVVPSTSAFLRADGAFTSALTPASVAAAGTVTGSNISGTNTGDQTITLTGDVTGSGTSSFSATLSNDAVSNAKLANVPTATFKGRTTAGTGDPEDLSVAQAKALLNLAGSNTGDQTITLTGDVTGSGTGSFAATVGANAVDNTKLADVGNSTIKGRYSPGTGDPEDLTVTQVKALLNLSGTNTGDQTSITGNAGTATALQTGRTIAISGAVTGTPTSFDGTANITIPITALNMDSASAGTLAVARGGTGTTTSTGTGSVVRSASPTFTGTANFAAISASGAISCASVAASGNVSAYSDIRMKVNVRTIPDALLRVTAMRGVTYQMKTTKDECSGVIAQELEAIAPELVSTDAKGLKAVAYGNLVGYLIEAVKELTARIEALEVK